MKKDNLFGIFTEEQMNNMSRESLMELLRIQQNRELQLKNQLKLAEEKLREVEFKNALLNDKLALAQHKRFGSSSEKYADGYEQINLFNEAEAEASPKAVEPEYEEIHPSPYKRKKVQGKKENDLSKFPVERIEYRLSEEEQICEDCMKKMKVVTTETHRYLKFIPAQFVTVEEVVFVYSCSKCSKMKRAFKGTFSLKRKHSHTIIGCRHYECKIRKWNATLPSGAGI